MTSYRHILHILVSATFFLLVSFCAFAGTASAQEIDVDYGGGPLFSEADFLPGDAEVRTFTVENLSGTQQEVRLRTVNESNTGLAEVLWMRVAKTAGAEYFNDTLLQLFAQDYVVLGSIGTGATEEYVIAATFLPQSGNGYQNGTAGFALCVGFAGDNENCVTDTDPNPGGYAQGSYNGGGGNGENISLTPSNDPDDDLPEGQIAGESTTTVPTVDRGGMPASIAQPFIDFVRGMVLGESADATTSTSTEVSQSSTDEAADAEEATGMPSVASQTSCTFAWLFLLAVILWSWSMFEDRLGRNANMFGAFFFRNSIFSALYVLALIAFYYFGVLEVFWWMFAGVWAVMAAADYFFHHRIFDLWDPRNRNIYYALASGVLALIGFFTPLLCVWIPFACIVAVSAVLIATDR